MPYRKEPITTNEIYHVFNRSIARQPIFLVQRDYQRIFEVINFYRFQNLPMRFSHFKRLETKEKERFIEMHMKNSNSMLEIFAYSIMPNHFHFLLKPVVDKAISIFMRNVQNSYSKYFNLKYDRTGSLLQAMFKAVRIETDEQLVHVCRYIHLSPVSSHIIKIENLEQYKWSSFRDYLSTRLKDSFINTNVILGYFKSHTEFKKFVFDQADYQQELEEIKHLVLE